MNLDDTSQCHVPDVCESCGGGPTAPIAVQTVLGVYCAGLCPSCVAARKPPPARSHTDTAVRVMAHCEHLECTVDEMAQAMED